MDVKALNNRLDEMAALAGELEKFAHGLEHDAGMETGTSRYVGGTAVVLRQLAREAKQAIEKEA